MALFVANEVNRLGKSLVARSIHGLEVVEGPQNVVVPPRREGEADKSRLDDGPGAMGAEQPVHEEELSTPPLGRANGRELAPAPSSQVPLDPCLASRRAPQPSRATFLRSRSTVRSAAPARSRSTCQRMAGSPARSQRIVSSAGIYLAAMIPLAQAAARSSSWSSSGPLAAFTRKPSGGAAGVPPHLARRTAIFSAA